MNEEQQSKFRELWDKYEKEMDEEIQQQRQFPKEHFHAIEVQYGNLSE